MDRRGFLNGVIGATGVFALTATIAKALGFNEFVKQDTEVNSAGSITSTELNDYFNGSRRSATHVNTIAEAREISESYGIRDKNHGDLWMNTESNELLMWNGWTQRWVGVMQ